jgi:RNA polymerase-binding protein DksA
VQDETGVGEVEADKTDVAVPVTCAAAAPDALAVLPGEEPWTGEEVAEARVELLSEIERLKAEIASSEAAVAGLMRDSGDGAGDEADAGSKNITREYELALAANTRETLTQAAHALQRLDEGTYGLCEVCGKPIGKARMQAFPRATLCLDDKQRQERR